MSSPSSYESDNVLTPETITIEANNVIQNLLPTKSHFLIERGWKVEYMTREQNIFGEGDILWIPRYVQDSTKESLATLGILL